MRDASAVRVRSSSIFIGVVTLFHLLFRGRLARDPDRVRATRRSSERRRSRAIVCADQASQSTAMFLWINDLRDDLDTAFIGRAAPRVIEIRYWTDELPGCSWALVRAIEPAPHRNPHPIPHPA